MAMFPVKAFGGILLVSSVLGGLVGCTPSGTVGAECASIETCDAGLVCTNGLCVQEDYAAASAAASADPQEASPNAEARGGATGGGSCAPYIACFQRCERELLSAPASEGLGALNSCRDACYEAHPRECERLDPAANACAAAQECIAMAMTRCPMGACNGAVMSINECREDFLATCPAAFAGR